jgi:hypothetical protein
MYTYLHNELKTGEVAILVSLLIRRFLPPCAQTFQDLTTSVSTLFVSIKVCFNATHQARGLGAKF